LCLDPDLPFLKRLVMDLSGSGSFLTTNVILLKAEYFSRDKQN
jgi:hypothetical protein